MIAKIIAHGSSFKGTVGYILSQEKSAVLIGADGVRLKNVDSIIDSMIMQSKLNPSISKPVGHIALSFSKVDETKLSNAFMQKVANEYMDKMGITDTSYLIARHFDKEHPHIHICYSRVDNRGKTISDKQDRLRSTRIAKELTINHNLYIAKGKENVNTYSLREPELTKYKLYESIKIASSISHNWQFFKLVLNAQNIEMDFKLKKNSKEVQGIKFSMNGYTFSGSKIDHKFSFSKLDSIFKSSDLEVVLNEQSSIQLNQETTKEASIENKTLDVLALFTGMSGGSSEEEGKEYQKRKTRKR